MVGTVNGPHSTATATPVGPPTQSGNTPVMTATGGLANEIKQALINMDQLRVIELKSLCKSLKLSTGGLKADLQERIGAFIKRSMCAGGIDPWRPKAINSLIAKLKQNETTLPLYFDVWEAIKTGRPLPSARQSLNTTEGTGQFRTYVGPPPNGTPQYTQQAVTSGGTQSINKNKNDKFTSESYVSSIFYRIIRKVSNSEMYLSQTEQRGRKQSMFKFYKSECLNPQTGSKYKLFLFCHEVTAYKRKGPEEIKFPFLNEISMNGKKITDNVRGIKNKPGTAKPADLTNFISDNGSNVVEILYAQTSKDFKATCYLVSEFSPEMLVQQQVLQRPKISRSVTLSFIKKTLSEESDDDFVTTSMILSLQCPISYTKMKYPAKSAKCDHIQCFDALWYLHSQRQVPTWLCPICSKVIHFEQLEISEYVEDIIRQSSDDVEQVQINTNGDWIPIHEDEPNDEKEKPNTKDEVKKEGTASLGSVATEDKHSHSHGGNADTVVISLDSEEEEEEEEEEPEREVATSATNVATNNIAVAPTGDINLPRNTDGDNNNHDSEVDSDEPLSQIRRRHPGSDNIDNTNNKNGHIEIVSGNVPNDSRSSNAGIVRAMNNNNDVSVSNIMEPSMFSSTLIAAQTESLQIPTPPADSLPNGATATKSVVPTTTATGTVTTTTTNDDDDDDDDTNLPKNDDGQIVTNTNNTTNNNPLLSSVTSTTTASPSNLLGLTGTFSTDKPGLFSNNSSNDSNNNKTISNSTRPSGANNKSLTTTNSANNSSSTSRRAANNIISPFIPRKFYPPSIPRKRSIERPNENKESGSTHSDAQLRNELGIEMSSGESVGQFDDNTEVIDLTSDD
ncbi:similar to Saccharomyces cerevisiae YDR409W SIZ1 SUMO/Smt3 ligase that promotes the attachment of sumo to proteins [Maudiozyma barnettii]|uniref:Similar to Saccharomyces cerevisiae YDR409W SIZ1 SUMO/Smt3 ligase that promotes the attachment of sumo to proteins n=1 Tax=Maudiozyma barnettii TaxID=61262 RepID=A0A8H2ZF22_9SACH|nr:uncharacterized protein KABA2_01S00462 [Kazachstania barnettii]CAB4251860.1 similar to Saccharomyces cerevisiae YDR409W SIZ1 SUMO/Smt3 ligase that promotes the attachment of sumo to proteins [Kazachstania barnettii]CAD1778141.1 similar to Saccharomyces cerevisiae YDR409W SIZ1 SUMO/Smt3 ligase that promotes the attachment of sumo to proteins [Kazachstania barnettii]